MKVIIILILILTVLLLIPIGIDGGYKEKKLILFAKIGPVSIKVFPRKNRLAINLKKPKKSKEEKVEHSEKKKRKFPGKGDIPDILRLGLKSLSRLRHRLKIEYIRIHYTFAANDPFDTAMGYAAANAAVGAFFPLVDEALDIKNRDFGIYCDFLSEKPAIEVWLTLTINLLDLFYIAIALGIDYLKLRANKKREERKNERNEANG